MTHICNLTTIFILLLLLGASSAGQSPVRFWATNAEEQPPQLIWHMAIYVDWKVTFTIENTSASDVIVYGWDQKDGTIDPVLYLLRFNKKTNSWDYPNSSNAPTPWEKESSIMKHEKLLKPGESLTFSRAFSRVSDCGRSVIVTAQIGAPKSKKTREIRSEEYVVPCSDKKPSTEDVAIFDAWSASSRRNVVPRSTSEYCSHLTVSMLAEKNTLRLSPRDDGEVTGVDGLIRDLHKYSDRWEIEFEIQNDSKLPLFFATEPMRSNGENGPYIGLGEADKTLEVGIRFFDRPNYFLSRDETNVKLKKLEPKTGLIEKYVLPLPLRETLPPYKERVTEIPRLIDANKIETLKLSVAVVPDDEGIRDLLAPKASKPYFDGYFDGGEIIEKGLFKGKMLLETQSLLSSTYKVNQ